MPDMRFAPPNPLRIADRATGLNAVSVRSYNERLVLSMLLQKEATTRLEIGERTGLSAQTISVIVRSLEHEGLVAKGEAQKGRAGPPTVPIALNPEGAFAVGVSVHDNKTDIVLVDFVGAMRFHASLPHAELAPEGNHTEFLRTLREAIEMVPSSARERLAGIGLALPQQSAEGNDSAYFEALREEIEAQLSMPVFVQNDITAAAGGESMFGVAKSLTDYMYFFLGERLHGRLILNHQIHHGNSTVSFDVGLSALREALGDNVALLAEERFEELIADQGFIAWEQSLVDQVTASVGAVRQFIEVQTATLSSSASRELCRRITEGVERRLPGLVVLPSGIGHSPTAVGAAGLAFSSRFMVQ